MLKKIGVIFGGNSTEHDASVHSYLNVISSYILDKKLSKIKQVIYIKNDQVYVFDKNFPIQETELTKGKAENLKDLLEIMDCSLYWFSLLHGNEGEDGCYQGLAEIFKLEGSFGEVLPACVSMNKWVMAELSQALTKSKVKYIPYLRIDFETKEKNVKDFLLDFPSDYYVIKPNRMGASLFTKKISKKDVLSFFRSKEFKNIFKYDKDVLLQKFIKGREFTFGLVEIDKTLVSLPLVEIFTSESFLGHKEKHKKGFVEVTFDKVEKNLKINIIKNSQLLYKELNFSNFCRFDYILSNNNLYLLEANSIPGIMSCSIFTKMIALKNISIPKMIDSFAAAKKYKCLKEYRYEIE